MLSDNGPSASTAHDDTSPLPPADGWAPSGAQRSPAGRIVEGSPRLRLLCVGSREPSWVRLTLQLDAEGCLEPQFRWVSTPNEAVTVLRDESFDCIVLSESPKDAPEQPACDPLSLVRAIRASGHDDPIVVLAAHLDDERWAELCHKNCEVLVTPNLWESPALVPVIQRAVRRVDMTREHHRLTVGQHRRLVRERDEAEHLLRQQWQLIVELKQGEETPSGASGALQRAAARSNASSQQVPPVSPSRFGLPPEINDYYHELLRTYVIMGSGSLGPEIAKLAEVIALAGLSLRDSLELHLERVESLIRGLGSRSARHVMARADLLALELMLHLGEWYQTHGRERAGRTNSREPAPPTPTGAASR